MEHEPNVKAAVVSAGATAAVEATTAAAAGATAATTAVSVEQSKLPGIAAMQERRSVRTFDGRAVSQEVIADILDFASKLDNPFNEKLQLSVLDNESQKLKCPVVVGTNVFLGGKIKRSPLALFAFGYEFEAILLHAIEKGLGTVWIAGTMDRPAYEVAMQLHDDEIMPAISPLGYMAEKMSLREKTMRRGVGADERQDVRELFFENDFEHPLNVEVDSALAIALEAVRQAPSAVNKQPWRIVVSGNKVHFYEAHTHNSSGRGFGDVQQLDMGIAACHFVIAMHEQGKDYQLEIADPGIATLHDCDYCFSFASQNEGECVLRTKY